MLFLLVLLASAHAAYTPTYGKYCGGGYTQANKAIPGIDRMDAACRIHDICYHDTGYSQCACDTVLLSALRQPNLCAGTSHEKYCRIYQEGARALFSAMPCRCPVRLAGHSFSLFRGSGGVC
jgi:hypothetical protein